MQNKLSLLMLYTKQSKLSLNCLKRGSSRRAKAKVCNAINSITYICYSISQKMPSKVTEHILINTTVHGAAVDPALT